MPTRSSPPATPTSPQAAPKAPPALPPAPPVSIPALLHRAQRALDTTQGGLGEMAGTSKRTGQRWAIGASVPAPFQLHDLAAKVHPADRGLASEIAAAGGTTLVALGLEPPPGPAPASPTEPPGASPAAPPAPPPFSPPPDRVVDSIVCAAADAMDMLPRQIRPALLAAFARARELGIAIADVEAALGAAEAKAAKATRPSSR